jgi:hypothetical protein
MSKFLKRIRKSVKKNLDQAIVVGSNTEQLEKLVDGFMTLFVIDHNHPPPRHKNIIHIQNVDFLATLTSIDLIILNQRFDIHHISFLHPMLRRIQPVILLDSAYTLTIEYYDYLRKFKYEQVDMLENYQIWKSVKK